MKRRTTKTKLLTALLALCMLLSLAPMGVFAADLTVSNEAELKAALEDEDCARIKLGGNLELTEALRVQRAVTLDLNGCTLTSGSRNESLFLVRSSGDLTVKDSAGGGKIDGQNRNCGAEVKGGTLTLESGSIVNCTDDGDGGAVDVSNTGVTETPIRYGKFIMNGGAIMDCTAEDDAGAVDIGSGCTFIMNGGTISGCRAEDDGGAVFIKQSGSFALNGGVIQNCSAGANGGAVNIYENGSFAMTGGTIKDCKVDLGGVGNGVYGKTSTAIVAISGGTIENCGEVPWSFFDEFTVIFDSDGGSAVAEQKLLNSPAVKPADPKKDGYVFAGWYLGNTAYAFDTKVAENITLKAHWTPVATPNTITAVVLEHIKFDYQPGDTPQATAQVAADQEQYVILYECWGKVDPAATEATAYWYSDAGYHPTGYAHLTAFEQGGQYRYSVRLEAKDGFVFSDSISTENMTLNGKSLPDGSDVLVLDAGKTCLITYGTVITPGGDSVPHSHSYGTGWAYDEAAHWHLCACGATAHRAAHTFKWVTDRQATARENGAKHEECTVCGYKKAAVVIPAIGTQTRPGEQSTQSALPQKSGKAVSPQTGKADHRILWLVLSAAGVCLTGTAVCGKRKKQNA